MAGSSRMAPRYFHDAASAALPQAPGPAVHPPGCWRRSQHSAHVEAKKPSTFGACYAEDEPWTPSTHCQYWSERSRLTTSTDCEVPTSSGTLGGWHRDHRELVAAASAASVGGGGGGGCYFRHPDEMRLTELVYRCGVAEAQTENATTMAILNIPYTYPRWKLLFDINQEGLPYDYFHCPRDTRKERSRGFAFVNFVTPEAAKAFQRSFNNRELSFPGTKAKMVTVLPSVLQGLEENAKLHPKGMMPARPPRQPTAAPPGGCDRAPPHQHQTGGIGPGPSHYSSSQPGYQEVQMPPNTPSRFVADGVVLYRLSL